MIVLHNTYIDTVEIALHFVILQGTRYSTSINTLLRDEGSFFYGMFCGKYNLRTSHDKSFFIDRDGTLFGYILNYLRTGHLILDFNDEILKRSLLLEAQFYRIQPLIHVLEPKVDSLILSEFHLKVLESWVSMEWLRSNRMNETVQTQQSAMVTVPKLKFVALYRASKHGFAASAFHRRCDHKKNTLTVIKANGTVFGGFTSIPWEATNDGRAVDQINPNTKSNNITFTYFLECHSDIWREKYNLIKSEKWDYCGSHQASYAKNPCYSVYHHKDCGPVFGYRPCFDYNGDLAAHILVGNDCDKNLNSRIDSFIGEHLSVRKHMTDSFFVSDYEVFQVSQI